MARSLKFLSLVGLLAAVVPAGPIAAQEPAPSCRLIRGAETPDDPSDDVTVCRQDVWFHETGNKLGNLAAFGSGSFPTFNTTKPTASVATGAGGGYVGTSTFHQLVEAWDPRGTAIFEGTFTGNLDSLAVTLYLFAPVKDAQQLTTFTTNARIQIGTGESLFEFSGSEVKYSLTSRFGAARIDFAVVNLYGLMEAAGFAGADRTHPIRLSVVGTGLATAAAMFVYDTSEVPSGMVFNIEPENLGSYTVIDAGV